MTDREVKAFEDKGLESTRGMLKRRTRLRVVQGLYIMRQNKDLSLSELWNDTKGWFAEQDSLEEEKPAANFEKLTCDQDLFNFIMQGAREQQTETEDFLLENLSASDRGEKYISVLLRCILQCALFELSGDYDSDRQKIIIADYVAVCGSFFGQKEVSLLNGLLSKRVCLS